MSIAGRYGNEIDTRKLRTSAQRRNRIPGMQNARDMVGGRGGEGKKGFKLTKAQPGLLIFIQASWPSNNLA